VCGGIVPELEHAWMPVERGLHDPPLHAAAPPMDQPHGVEAGGGGRVNVLGDDRRNVPRGEGVEIDLAFDWNACGHGSPSPPS
jgi:hypothetical protein